MMASNTQYTDDFVDKCSQDVVINANINELERYDEHDSNDEVTKNI